MKILQSFAISLNIKDDDGNWFSNKHRYEMKSGDNFRILHYPPITIEDGKVSEEINYDQNIRAGRLIFFHIFFIHCNYIMTVITFLDCKYHKFNSHTDYGSLTLLFQKDIGGLEIQHPYTKKWLQASVIPNTILINIGDLMEFWTKGLFKSTKHRVIFNNENMILHRYSMAYFCHAESDVGLDPIPSEFISEKEVEEEEEREKSIEINERRR